MIQWDPSKRTGIKMISVSNLDHKNRNYFSKRFYAFFELNSQVVFGN